MQSTDSLTLIFKISNLIINPIIYLLFSVAIVVFLWGVLQYFLQSDSEDAKTQASQHMLYGIIGIFIMISVFGITRLIMNTLSVPEDQRPQTIPR
ncbi:MAG: hypothetical protein WCW87_01565 [Candidatus Paceibacterota bacterium]